MSWLADNGLWVLFIGGFIGLHFLGHKAGIGCCGHSHGKEKSSSSVDPDDTSSNQHGGSFKDGP